MVSSIAEKLSNAKQALLIPGIIVERFGYRGLTEDVINTSGLPFVTLESDESVIDETNPSYLGLYCGQLINPEIREFVESCDCILAVGAILSDFNTGMFTAKLDNALIINIMPYEVHIGDAENHHVKMGGVLET